MTDDRQLLDRYVSEGSDDAFRELVRRHMALVYSAAIRQVRQPQLAQDVTQLVFVNLARKARAIPAGTVLAGWLHRDTRYTALDLLRAESRRARREQHAAAMNALDYEPLQDWQQIRPLLDEALDELGPEDRDALLLRYFQECDFAEVGAALGASGEAARKRVDRALDRLRESLVKRGITTTAAALGVTLSIHAIETVPAGFASALVAGSAALAAKAAAPAAASWLANLLVMTNTKIVAGSIVAVAALTVPLVIQQRAIASAQTEQSALLTRQQNLTAQTQSMAGPKAALNASDPGQSERADLERLRRENGALRAHLAELNQQAQLLAQARHPGASHSPGGTPINQVLDFRDVRDVGQATPAATLQTFMWAMLNAQSNRMQELLSFDPAIDTNAFRRAWDDIGKVLAEAAKKGPEALIAERGQSFRIVEEQPAESGDRWIVAQDEGQEGKGGGPIRFRFTSSAGGWRLLIGTNGEPVGGPIENQP